MKKLIQVLTGVIGHLLLTSFALTPSDVGIIYGTVKEHVSSEPIPFANVAVLKDGQVIAGASTDLSGRFKISGLAVGSYSVSASCVGYSSKQIDSVVVISGQTVQVDFVMTAGLDLQEVRIISHQVPMTVRHGSSKMVVSGSDIQKMPSRGARVAPSLTTVAGININDGRVGSIRGTRQASTDTYIDGVKVRGSANLPQAAYEHVQILTPGVPAQFGDVTGGVIAIERGRQFSAPGLSGHDGIPLRKKKKLLIPEGLPAGYDLYRQQSFKNVFAEPLSTFSIDVDAASYSQIRRSLNMGSLPPTEIVRIEEMINYFSYDYPQPEGEDPFSITTEVSDCPWNSANKLVHIGLQGKHLVMENRPRNNLVFLIDVSGSMSSHDKLPLLKQSLRLLIKELEETDKISIVVYAGAAGLVLPSTSGDKKQKLFEAIEFLSAGGSTAGGAGIELAYSIAQKEFIKEGNNRVILCTDGDFNVGVSSDDDLVKLIEKKRESGVFLTVLGFGTGNFQDGKMEKLADKGNGNFAYIDNLQEAQKVLVQEFWGTLFTIAKDVKIQVEFNPANVLAYRLIGYENRRLAAEDFNDDRKDAGELGAGHTVTALYEVIPTGAELPDGGPLVDTLKYQLAKPTLASGHDDELLTVKLRYKKPDGDVSKLLVKPLANQSAALDSSSADMRFSASLALFGMILLDKELKPEQRVHQIEQVIGLATSGKGVDEDGRRAEFLRLAELAMVVE